VSFEIGENIKIRSTNKVALFIDEVDGSGDEAHILISGPSCNALQGLITDSKTEILYNDSSVFFKNDETEVMIVQQQGNFPIAMFNTIIENGKNSSRFKVDFQEFITSIKRTSILSAKEKFSPLKLNIKDKKVEFSFDNINTSSRANETIKGKFKSDLLIGFNHRFLLEILSVFDSDCVFKISDNNFFCIQDGNKFGILAPTQINQ
jgi:DNA polymerase III sliding clamp (beta) subunit (PCNA family)